MTPVPAHSAARLTWPIAALLAGFAILTVYATFGSIHVMDMGTKTVYADQSLREYHDAIAGTRAFPYQWRLLGPFLVYVGEQATGLDPHAIDVTLKVLFLTASSLALFLFSGLYTSATGALLAVALNDVLTVAGFTDGYSIYYTSDYAMVAAFFGVVYAVRLQRWPLAAWLTLVGATAKETLLLAPILMGLGWLRRRVPFWAVVLVGVAFVLPTAVLRWAYPAPLSRWAWWDMAFANVPGLQRSVSEFFLTLKNNAKVLLFFNVLWWLAARGVRRSEDPFVKDLAITFGLYLVMAYPVIYIRELRHFLPLAILILPLAIRELERGDAAPPVQG